MLKNSGGIALAVSNSFDSDNTEILENNNELSFGFKVEKEHIHLDKDLIMAVAYFPPVGSEYKNDECFEILQNDIIKVYNPNESYLLLTGDLNSRTKNISEIAQTDTELLELCNIDSNDVENNDNSAYVVTIFEELGIPICRKSLDSQSNTFGHRLIELCKNNNLVILNCLVGEDQNIGNFTTTRNSMVDYIIMSANSLKFLRYTSLTPFCQTYTVLFHVIYLQNTKPTYIVAKKTAKKKIKQRPKQKQQTSVNGQKKKVKNF